MDADDILARQVEQLDKEKRELQIRLKTQEKKVKNDCSVVGKLLPPHPTPPSLQKKSPPPKKIIHHKSRKCLDVVGCCNSSY